MAINIKKMLQRKYEVDMVCSNCGAPNKTQIPKGTNVEDFIKTGSFICDVCGCSTKPGEYKTKWLK